jgi:hypothetical protein
MFKGLTARLLYKSFGVKGLNVHYSRIDCLKSMSAGNLVSCMNQVVSGARVDTKHGYWLCHPVNWCPERISQCVGRKFL